VTHNENYGYVGYTHALGIDAPVGMIRNREVVVLHQNWRGKYAWST